MARHDKSMTQIDQPPAANSDHTSSAYLRGEMVWTSNTRRRSDAPPASHARRPSGRDAKRASRAARAASSIPYITRKIPYYEVLSEEGLALLEHNADTILEEIGIDFRDDAEAIEIWKAAGADVKGERVHFARGMCRRSCSGPRRASSFSTRATPRAMWSSAARTPCSRPPTARRSCAVSTKAGATRGSRTSAISSSSPIMLDSLHHSGGTICEPVDLPVNKRHLDMVYSHLKYSDKAFMGSVTAPERAADSVAMANIVFGAELNDPATGRPKTTIINLINVNSPMTYDATMLGAAKVYARANQALIITPFILAGAMSPVTVAGTVAQTLAEALAGLAFVQLVNPGAPVVLGSFASSISMQSGAPTFGTPEPALVLYSMAALARRLGIPFRSGGSLCASKIPDAQAAFESANTLLPDLPRGRQFRAAHGRLARGRPGHGLREIRHGRRPGRHDAHAARGRGFVGRTAKRSMRCARSDPVNTSSAAPTRRPISRTPSIARRSPTTTATSSGRPRARPTCRSAPTRCGRSSSRSMCRRRWILPSTRRCSTTWRGARRRSPIRTFDRRAATRVFDGSARRGRRPRVSLWLVDSLGAGRSTALRRFG